MSNDPVKDCLAAAFHALLRGDTAERDRQCARAESIMAAQAATAKIDIGRDEIVGRLLRLAEHEAGLPLSDQERTMIERHPAALLKRLLEAGYRLPVGFT